MENMLAAITINIPGWETIWTWVQPILAFAFTVFMGGSLLTIRVYLRGIKAKLVEVNEVLESVKANQVTLAKEVGESVAKAVSEVTEGEG